MSLLFSEASVLIHSLGWTLIHSLWQGAVISAGLWLVLKMIPNAGSETKYHMALAALSLLVVWVICTWMQQWQIMQAISVQVTESAVGSIPPKTYTITTQPQSTATWHWLMQVQPQLEQAFPLVIRIYLVGLLFMLLRFAGGFAALYKIRNRNITLPEARWIQLLKQLQERLDMNNNIHFFLSTRTLVPIMVGVLKPVILLPVSILSQLSPDQVEAILLHELAHIRRHDYLVNILQSVLEAILFFNPFIWKISAVIRREREHCCDDIVLAHTSEPLPYARALAALETVRSLHYSGALAASGQPRHLFNRIKRILEMKKNQLNTGRIVATFLLVTVIVCAVIWLTPSLAQSKNNKKDGSGSKSFKKERIWVNDSNGHIREYHSISEDPNAEGALKEINNSLPALDSLTQLAAIAHMDFDTALLNQNLGNIGKIVTEAMNKVDWNQLSKVQQEAFKKAGDALEHIDWNKINKEQRQALREAGNAMKEARQEMKEVNSAQIQKEMDEAMKEMKKIDWQKIHEEMNKELAQANSTRAEALAEAAEARAESEKAMAEAVAGDNVFKVEKKGDHQYTKCDKALAAAGGPHSQVIMEAKDIRPYTEMLRQMEADGLIRRADGFNIEKKGSRLFINGKEQPESVLHKYQLQLSGRHIVLSGTENTISATVDND